MKAVDNIIKLIAPALIGMDPSAQQAIDDKMVQVRPTNLTPLHTTPPRTWHLAAHAPRSAPHLTAPTAQELDGSKNEWGWSKSKLGANAILAVSMAACKAGAELHRATPSYTALCSTELLCTHALHCTLLYTPQAPRPSASRCTSTSPCSRATPRIRCNSLPPRLPRHLPPPCHPHATHMLPPPCHPPATHLPP